MGSTLVDVDFWWAGIINFCFGVACSVVIILFNSSTGCKVLCEEALLIVFTAVSFDLLNSVMYGLRGKDRDLAFRPEKGLILD